jgi:cellulose synthase/poly-beta-1,6-N-acetylglucosamine synthase-like glycosyltransferase
VGDLSPFVSKNDYIRYIVLANSLISERRWICLVFGFVGLWLLVLGSTLYTTITKSGLLIDTEVDLSYITLPLLGIILLYTLVTIFIFVVYFLAYNRVERDQLNMYNAQGKFRIGQSERAGPKGLIRLFLFVGLMGRYVVLNLYQRMIRQENKSLKKPQLRQKIQYAENAQVESHPAKPKTCSIIIPSRNEESVIKRTITECLEQTYRDIEIIVVCHNCTDSTFQEARHPDKRVKAFDLKTVESGKGIALNYGLKQSSGEFVLILDGDGILSRDFIEKALPLFDANYAAVQGRYMPSNRDYNILTKLLSIEGDLWSTPYMTARSFLEKRCGLGGTGYIVRKSVLIDEGMFANHLVDDYELTFRLLKSKHRIAFAPLSIDYDEKPPNLEIMLRQRARWARGFLSLLSKRIAEPTDIIGNIHWLSPVAAISGIIMLLIPAYASIHYLLYDYYPYTYSYMPLNLWFILTGLIYGLQAAILYKQDGVKGLKRALYLPIYNAFSHYWFVSFSKAFFVKSWANTKTMHGFVKKSKEKPKVTPNISSR